MMLKLVFMRTGRSCRWKIRRLRHDETIVAKKSIHWANSRMTEFSPRFPAYLRGLIHIPSTWSRFRIFHRVHPKCTKNSEGAEVSLCIKYVCGSRKNYIYMIVIVENEWNKKKKIYGYMTVIIALLLLLCNTVLF